MNRNKIGSVCWAVLAVLIPFGILRMITKASYHDFAGKGTFIYVLIASLYILITICLAFTYSKKFFYYILLLGGLTVSYPVLLIVVLNNFAIK
ncbi:hypothetical protein ACYSNW_16265 [Enterococcus sp. LJL99]